MNMLSRVCKGQTLTSRLSLIMFVGLPGAGKSTQASLLRALIRSRGCRTLFVDVGYAGLFMRPLWILCDKLWRHMIGSCIRDYKQELIAERIVRSFKRRVKTLFILASILNLIAQLLFINFLRLCNYILFAEGYIVDTILCALHENIILDMPQSLRKLFHKIAFKVLSSITGYSVVVVLDYSPMLVDTRRKITDNPYRFQLHYLKRYRRMYLRFLHNLSFMRFIIVQTDRMPIIETFRTIMKRLLNENFRRCLH